MDQKIEDKVKASLIKQAVTIECLEEENTYLKQQIERLTTALNNLKMFDSSKR